jgi:cytoskeletal protein RodZ
MSATDKTTEADEEEIESSGTPLADPGAMLVEAREAQGITISRMARDLGLTESAVRQLEQNLYDKFPAGIYVRGYIKNYCKVVSLNQEEVMEVLEEFITLNGTLASHGSNYDPLGEFANEKKKMAPLIIPSVIAVILLAAYIAYRVFAA